MMLTCWKRECDGSTRYSPSMWRKHWVIVLFHLGVNLSPSKDKVCFTQNVVHVCVWQTDTIRSVIRLWLIYNFENVISLYVPSVTQWYVFTKDVICSLCTSINRPPSSVMCVGQHTLSPTQLSLPSMLDYANSLVKVHICFHYSL